MSDDLVNTALLGEKAREFVESELGMKLLEMAMQESEAAALQLEDVDPTDVKTIMQLQNRVKLGRMFHNYLAELMSKGDEAIVVFKQQTGEA